MTVRRITCSLATALVAAALSAPTALAIPDYPTGPSPVVSSSAQTAPDTVRVPGSGVVVDADEASGFDWGSAAIGAAALTAVALLAGAGAMTFARHGRMRPTTGGQAR